jgi:DedD protein
MQDQDFHEIQLSGKQLLFGFISAVVLLVVIFLLGVSVGRGVRTDEAGAAQAAAAAPSDTVVSATPPPATTPQPGDLNYQQVLKGAPPPVSTPPDVQPPASPPSAAANPPASGAGDPQKPSPAPATPPGDAGKAAATAQSTPPPATDKKPAPPAGGAWYAQLGAYGTERAAESVMKDATAKGFKPTVSPYGQFFRVRIGPFATQAEAEREKARLAKAGIQSSVIR